MSTQIPDEVPEVRNVFGVELQRSRWCRDSATHGGFVLEIDFGDERKCTKKPWAKKLENVDTSQRGGYAFVGDWVPKFRGEAKVVMKPGDAVVAVISTGSWKHPGQVLRLYLALNDWVYYVDWEWGRHPLDDAETVAEIAKVFSEFKKIMRGE